MTTPNKNINQLQTGELPTAKQDKKDSSVHMSNPENAEAHSTIFTQPDTSSLNDVNNQTGKTSSDVEMLPTNTTTIPASNYLTYWDGNDFSASSVYYDGTKYGIGTTTPSETLHLNNGRLRAKAMVFDENAEVLSNQVTYSDERFHGTGFSGAARTFMFKDFADYKSLWEGFTNAEKTNLQFDFHYLETEIWYDGTVMTSEKVDDKIFIEKNGKFYQKTIPKDILLKIGTVSELRQTNAYYEGQEILLLGYYESGDKSSVLYKFTVQNFTSSIDDGGSIIKTDRGVWIAQFNGKCNIKDFGALNLQNIDGIVSHILSIEDIYTIEIDKGTYRIPVASSIEIPANKKLVLHEQTEIRKASASGFTPSIILNGDNAKLINGKFITEGNSLHEGTIVIKNGDNIEIRNSRFENSTIGIRVMPNIGEKVSNLNIIGTKYNNCKYHIDLGKGVDAPVGEIEDVNITLMTSKNGKDIAEGGDGIKTRQKVKRLNIILCTIDSPSRDCIDLFASGDEILISKCTFRNAKVKGIDIKREPLYDESIYGKNGRLITLDDNRFEGMSIGISISGNYEVGNYKSNRFIIIKNNTFVRVKTRAIAVAGKYIRICGNTFLNCSDNDTLNYPSIDVGQDSLDNNSITSDIFISDNTFINNSCAIAPSQNTQAVIRVANYCKGINIENNIIKNDADEDRATQYIGIYVNSNSEVYIKNNTISVLGKPLHIISGATVIGNKLFFTLGTKPAQFNRIIKLLKFDRKAQLINADISVGVAVTGDSSNYSTADLQINGLTAVPFNTIANVDTNINRKYITANYMVEPGQDLQVRFNNAGTGVTLENLMITLNYIDC
jgi:hypothetical protein